MKHIGSGICLLAAGNVLSIQDVDWWWVFFAFLLAFVVIGDSVKKND